ncbi:hypothetical protein GLA29479_2127 [Lysobacter antibioticus]|nr:hypothetical protein GLA29479_2127 [Lysobacter antibioticus]
MPKSSAEAACCRGVGAASYWISFGHKPRPRCNGFAAFRSSKIKIKIKIRIKR